MTPDSTLGRSLGAAFIFVFAASLLSGLLINSALGVELFGNTASISDTLTNVSNNAALMRAGILVELLNVAGITILAALLYRALKQQNHTLALIALGWWLAEGVLLAVSSIGAYELISLGHAFMEAGAPEASPYQQLGAFLYHGLDGRAYDLHMLFFCLGALIWYSLFYQSALIPRALPLWGLTSVALVTLGSLILLYDAAISVPTLLYVPYIPFELVIGVWLVAKGFRRPATKPAALGGLSLP